MRHTNTARPWLGLAAGAIGGLAASAAMAGAQAVLAGLKGDGGGDPATVKAADAASEAITGQPIAGPYRESAGQAVHYLTGTLLGAAYGLLVEYRPGAAAGFGTGYGTAVAALLDEAVVPAAGLGEAPQNTPLGTHLFSLASHLVFGAALEATRRLIAGRA